MPRLRTLLLALPLIELALLIVVGTAIGGGTILLIVLGTFVAGLALFQFARRGTPPAMQRGHPAMAIVGGGPSLASGMLLMIPGLLTDLLGVLLLVPGFRKLLLAGGRKLVARRLAKAGLGPEMFGGASPLDLFGGAGGPAPSRGPDGPLIVEAEVVDERPDD